MPLNLRSPRICVIAPGSGKDLRKGVSPASIIHYLAAIKTGMARIVIMLNRLVIGGAPMDTVQLAGFLSARHEVYLLTGEKNEDELDARFLTSGYPRLQVIPTPFIKRSPDIFKDIRAFFRTRKLLRRLNPDIVHTHGAKSGLIGRLAAASIGVKVILHTYHGHVFHSYFSRFISGLIVRVERWLAGFTTCIIAISERQKTELVDTYRICKGEKMVVIKLGIDIEKFIDATGSRRKRFRDMYLVSPDEVAVGIVGRIVPVKGHAFFADVVEEIMKTAPRRFRFFVIGDGMLRPQLEQRFKEKKIDTVLFPAAQRPGLITFTSWILNIEEAMAGLDIIVLTSLNEGTPVTVLEAQAAAKPVVATDVGAVKEIIPSANAGFVVAYGEVQQFAARILQLAGDEPLRTQTGEYGRLFVQQHHTRKKPFEAMEKLYTKLLEV